MHKFTFFAFRLLAKITTISLESDSRKNAKYSRNNKCKYFSEKYEIGIINYDIIKRLMLTSQCGEFHKIFCIINFTAATPMVRGGYGGGGTTAPPEIFMNSFSMACLRERNPSAKHEKYLS